jgi:hypothetical protein
VLARSVTNWVMGCSASTPCVLEARVVDFNPLQGYLTVRTAASEMSVFIRRKDFPLQPSRKQTGEAFRSFFGKTVYIVASALLRRSTDGEWILEGMFAPRLGTSAHERLLQTAIEEHPLAAVLAESMVPVS